MEPRGLIIIILALISSFVVTIGSNIGNVTTSMTSLLVLKPESPDAPKLTMNHDFIDGTGARVTCSADNNYPSPIVQWYIGQTDITRQSRTTIRPDINGLVYVRSTLEFVPSKVDQGKNLTCKVTQETPPSPFSVYSQNASLVLDILYPPVIHNLTFQQFVTDVQFNCQAFANPPVSQFTWFHNGSSLNNPGNLRIPTIPHESWSEITIRDVSSQHQGEYKCVASTARESGSSVINYTFPFTPESPSNLHVRRNQTPPSRLIVAWQPGFYGGFQQTFNLQYCTDETREQLHQNCKLVKRIIGRTHTLTGLQSFTRYKLTLWASNIAGNSDNITLMTSTPPLSPENYGVFITWNREDKILAFSDWTNSNQSFKDICFIIIRNSAYGKDCASANKTQCIDAGTEVDTDPEEDLVVVTFGRGLCSEPAYISLAKPSSRISLLLTIMLGVVGISASTLLMAWCLVCVLRLCKVGTTKNDDPSERETQPCNDRMKDGVTSLGLDRQENDYPLRATPGRLVTFDRSTNQAIQNYNTLGHVGTVHDYDVVATSDEEEDSLVMHKDGLLYLDLSHEARPTRRPAPIRLKEGTVYAALDFDAMEARKNTKSITSILLEDDTSDEETLYINM